MKRRKVMRLLAVAMAASLAVTSQGIPAGLNAVFAADATTKESLTDGYYVELTSYITPHTDTAACYTEQTATDVTAADNYYQETNSGASDLDSKYTKVNEGAVIKPGTDVEYEEIENGTQAVLKDDSNHTVYNVANSTAVESIYATQATADETAGKDQSTAAGIEKAKYVTIGKDNQAKLNAAVGEYTGAGDTGEIVFSSNESYASAAESIADATVYEVTKYIKHKHNGDAESSDSDDTELKKLPGVITIPDLTGDSDGSLKNAYIDLLGDAVESETVAKDEIYIPVTVKAYVPVFSEMGTSDDGIEVTGTTYKLASKTEGTDGGAATEVWVITSTTPENQPKNDTHYQWLSTANGGKGNFVIHIADKILSDDKDNELNSSKDHSDTYDFTTASDETSKLVIAAVTAQNEESILKGSINDKNSNIVKNSGTYYLDVTKYFISSIALKGASTQYYLDGDTADSYDDSVTLTYANNTSDPAKTATLDSDKVVSEFTNESTHAGVAVKSFNLGSDNYYYVVEKETANGILETDEVKTLSSISSVEEFKTSKLSGDENGISITLSALTAPVIELSVTPSTDQQNDSKDVYNISSKPTVSASITNDPTAADDHSWLYTWSDEVNSEDQISNAESIKGTDLASKSYEISNKKLGLHTITLTANYVADTDPTTSLKSVTTSVSVYMMDKTQATVDYETSYVYDGNKIVNPALSTGVTEGVVYTYYNKTAPTEALTENPSDVGEYTYKVTVPADYTNGYLEDELTGEFAITPASETVTVDDQNVAAYVEGGTNNATEITLSDMETFDASNEAQIDGTFTVDDSALTDFAYNAATHTLSFKVASTVTTTKTGVTFSGVLKTKNYNVTVKGTVNIKDASTKDANITADAVSWTYGENTTAEAAQAAVEAKIKNDQEGGAYTITYAPENSKDYSETVPTDAGTYDVKISYNRAADGDTPAAIGSAAAKLTIAAKKITVDTGSDTVTAYAAEGENTHTVNLKDILSASEAGAEAVANGVEIKTTFAGETTNSIFADAISYTPGTGILSYTLGEKATAGHAAETITGVLTTKNYEITVTYAVATAAAGTKVEKPAFLSSMPTYYYGDQASDYVPTSDIIDNPYETGEYKYTYQKVGATETKNTFPTDAGTYLVTVKYDGTVEGTTITGENTTTITINPKPVTIKATAQTINVGGSFAAGAYTFEAGAGEKLTTFPAVLNPVAKVTDSTGKDVTESIPTSAVATYKLTFTYTANDNYAVTVKDADLTVKSGSYSGDGGNGSSNSSTGTTTTEPTLTTNEDGDKVIVDADGKVIADELVTIDGKSYVTDENGEVLTSQIAEVGDVKVYVGKNGVVATDKAVTYEGKKYYATENGEIATNRFVETARGNMVYATKTGALKTSTAFTVNGKKYYAKASGVIATTGFVKTAKGNTVYATKSGALKVNTAFKASNGKKYVADKNGKIVKGKKITIGNKVYTTNKKGVVTKVTTKKK